MLKLKTSNHAKHLLLFHLIFVCKYRYKVLENRLIDTKVKELSLEITKRKDFKIHFMESDKDHIHYMIELKPKHQFCKIVNNMKSFITYHICKELPNEISKYYYNNKHVLFTGGYFISSIGNVSQETLRKYIEEQGN